MTESGLESLLFGRRLKIAQMVTVKGWPTSLVFEVVDTSDPSLVTLQAETGATLKVGRLMVLPATDVVNDDGDPAHKG